MAETTERETIFEGSGSPPAIERSRRVDHFGHRLPRDLLVLHARHLATEGRLSEARELVSLSLGAAS